MVGWAFVALVSVPAQAVRAQNGLQIELRAPDAVRAVLERHVRALSRTDQVVPDLRADRIALIRRTRREVRSILATEGYFAPEVELERAERGQWILSVEPGRQASVAAVELSFDGHLAEPGGEIRRESLRRQWSLPVGQGFRQADWDGAKQGLLDAVSLRDYAAARITASRAEVDPTAASVRLAVTVDSGPPFRLGEIEVSGLKRLPADLVSRLGRLTPGEPFDQERLLAFQGALQAAPQFASVIVDIERDPARAAAAPVRVAVSEARSRHLGFGAGYSTNAGARAELNWRDVNLFGRAWELSTGLRIEQRRQSAYADLFLPPAPKGVRDSLGAVVERSDIEGLATTRQAIGIVRNYQRGAIETGVGVRYQRETLRPLGGLESQRKALTANWSWTLRRVDDLLDPRVGHVLHVELGGGARALLSDQDFFRMYGRAVRYQPIGERDVLILRGEAGATVARSRDGIPQDFLFRTGGAQSVRGYAYESLGVEEGRATLGGRLMAVLGAEYVHWFRPQWGVAAFVDAGDAADDRRSFRIRQGYGVGARWRSPAGPIALDLAYGRQARRLRLHFAIAVAF
ncbi:MAG: outer membrane protein assembly factor [Rhodocyclaceae bacterium]|nr:outer membrane protein assembly factor [Rhodocyclaceae bacterium]